LRNVSLLWRATRYDWERHAANDGESSLDLAAGAGFGSKVRMIAVDTEVQQWSRRMALGLVPMGQEWLTAVL
jgi:hypothetical protein